MGIEIRLGNEQSPETQDKDLLLAKERRKAAEAVCWSAFFCVLVLGLVLVNVPTWPVAVGVVGIAIALTIIMGIILLRR